ncbi:MAG TPA: hypothetical protein VFN61_15345 [Acidimicrobiales bacterium]|nr:hypothetical protein [Acidimicrobiales bacterium]
MSDPSLPQYPEFPAAPPVYPVTGPAGEVGVPEPPVKPASLKRAVYFICAGALLSLIEFAAAIASPGPLRHTLKVRLPHDTASQINQVVDSAIIVLGIFVALWAFLAWANDRGYNWARITGSVLFALYTLVSLGSLSILSLLTWACGLGAVILMWRRSSSEYYRRPR